MDEQLRLGFDTEDVAAREAIIRRILDVEGLRGADGRPLTEAGRAGVVELCLRVSAVAGPTSADRAIVAKAQVSFLSGSGKVRRPLERDPRLIHHAKSVSERTLSGRWARDAEALGVLRKDVRVLQVGGTEWNVWTVFLKVIETVTSRPTRSDVVGRGRTWSDVVGPYKQDNQEIKPPSNRNAATNATLADGEFVWNGFRCPRSHAAGLVSQKLTFEAATSALDRAMAVAAHPANTRHFTKPAGAAWYRVCFGRWPVADGVNVLENAKDLALWEARENRAQTARRTAKVEQARERVRYEAHAFRRELLRRNVAPHEARRAVIDRYGEAMAADMVWSDLEAREAETC
jgi:hypothetical protein